VVRLPDIKFSRVVDQGSVTGEWFSGSTTIARAEDPNQTTDVREWSASQAASGDASLAGGLASAYIIKVLIDFY